MKYLFPILFALQLQAQGQVGLSTSYQYGLRSKEYIINLSPLHEFGLGPTYKSQVAPYVQFLGGLLFSRSKQENDLQYRIISHSIMASVEMRHSFPFLEQFYIGLQTALGLGDTTYSNEKIGYNFRDNRWQERYRFGLTLTWDNSVISPSLITYRQFAKRKLTTQSHWGFGLGVTFWPSTLF